MLEFRMQCLIDTSSGNRQSARHPASSDSSLPYSAEACCASRLFVGNSAAVFVVLATAYATTQNLKKCAFVRQASVVRGIFRGALRLTACFAHVTTKVKRNDIAAFPGWYAMKEGSFELGLLFSFGNQPADSCSGLQLSGMVINLSRPKHGILRFV